jgi:hypothetical protein
VAVWWLTEESTRWGRLIAEWRAEYFDGNGIAKGSLKFRTAEGHAFMNLALPWSLLVYPLGGACLFCAARLAKRSAQKSSRAAWMALALLTGLILGRFVWLGIFTSVVQSL